MRNSYPQAILSQEIFIFKINYETDDQYLQSLRLGQYGNCYSRMSVLPVGQISACCG